MGVEDLEQIEFRSRGELRKWLAKNHPSADKFWLVMYKKHVPDFYIPYGDVVEELLCFGWIDGRTRRLDDDRTMLLVAPRKSGSTWSAPNKQRVEALNEAGMMQPAGQAKIDEAKQDGSWEFLDDIDNLVIPDDLAAALAKNKRATKYFDAFSNSSKKIILYWIKTAKRDATRQKRISETVRLAAKNIKAATPAAYGQ